MKLYLKQVSDFEEVDKSKAGLKAHRIEKVMIWTEKQATFRQTTQIGTSACGVTAVINALVCIFILN